MKPGDTRPHVVISAVTFYALGDLQAGMAAIRKCLHSDPDSKVCKKLLKQEKAVEKTWGKVNKALDKGQSMTAVRQLVPTADDEGLIKEVKDQVEALRADETIPKAVGNVLVARLVDMACQAYYEVRRPPDLPRESSQKTDIDTRKNSQTAKRRPNTARRP